MTHLQLRELLLLQVAQSRAIDLALMRGFPFLQRAHLYGQNAREIIIVQLTVTQKPDVNPRSLKAVLRYLVPVREGRQHTCSRRCVLASCVAMRCFASSSPGLSR